LEELRKATKNLVRVGGVSAEVRTEELSNMNQSVIATRNQLDDDALICSDAMAPNVNNELERMSVETVVS
jgi:hypothetical protein